MSENNGRERDIEMDTTPELQRKSGSPMDETDGRAESVDMNTSQEPERKSGSPMDETNGCAKRLYINASHEPGRKSGSPMNVDLNAISSDMRNENEKGREEPEDQDLEYQDEEGRNVKVSQTPNQHPSRQAFSAAITDAFQASRIVQSFLRELKTAQEEWLDFCTAEEAVEVGVLADTVNRKIVELNDLAAEQGARLREYEAVARERMREQALDEEEEGEERGRTRTRSG